jgi:hypothetical protein
VSAAAEEAEVTGPSHAVEAPEPEPAVAATEPEPAPVDLREPAATMGEADHPGPLAASAAESAPARFTEPVPAEPAPVYRPPEPEPVVTETMAEVLLQQGHAAEALGVYRELASRSGDARLQQRVADLGRQQRRNSILSRLARDASR